ncbi:phage repressor protein CI [Enterobacter cloacae]|uniref:phage repressor protein CI n=1 Tax=Enterobacter cloacae complex TaxID=354276 RepID=UPI001FF64BB0|nr:phage repressor protein CI [Enterobacter cloacae]MCK1077720.1 helix-turn-helix domain-containing protein [Enterobacter cloacae subsp. cloacae]HAS1736520.1 phage repressor protein CI [Enterobacter cloacae]HCB2125183.1 phage repressor protein CI [Enterobacter cloacae]HCT2370206.1 phage repressor protein CI [Enterobacter cloacae]HDQ2828750.1 phage repressor protein CI [Enterobacter cloacae]
MRIEGLGLNNEEVLDRICEAYGFSQKIQLARHFEIASSSLANRYSRDSISYDFIVHCALETGADLAWLLTGKGSLTTGSSKTDTQNVDKFTLSEESLINDGALSITGKFFSKPLSNPIAVYADGKLHFIERNASLADGEWLVDIEGAISIRELTKLPGKKLHVAGGKVPFECGFDDIKTLGRVVGIYSEVN